MRRPRLETGHFQRVDRHGLGAPTRVLTGVLAVRDGSLDDRIGEAHGIDDRREDSLIAVALAEFCAEHPEAMRKAGMTTEERETIDDLANAEADRKDE